MDKQRKEHRDRLVALTFVSVLLLLIYGPAASLFIGADRFMYDRLASLVPNTALENATIVTIDPSNKSEQEIINEYGQVLQALNARQANRIIMANPPAIDESAELPGWAALLTAGVPVYVPSQHRLANVAANTGILSLPEDSDGILRQSEMWHLQGGIMSPSLPLAVALNDPEFAADPRVAATDVTLYFSNYEPLPRLSASELLLLPADNRGLSGQTIFLDADLPLVHASATLPSREYVTLSEVSAAILGNIWRQETIISPTWLRALELLTPAILAILAVLYLPGRGRNDILMVTAGAIAGLILIEAIFLIVWRIRLDLGRPMIVFMGASILSWWLAGGIKQASIVALSRGRDFLAAGRLEPAFAEFRQCAPNESLHNAMYKLSLAFEQQAKPERAEAVINWMKQTQGGTTGVDHLATFGQGDKPKRLGRYVIERKIGRGAMGAVYLARDPRINRPVALKVIPIEKEFEDEELEEARLRFFREAESAGRLTHPNIITVYDVGEDKQLAYIAMEYLAGKPLTEWTDEKRLLAPRKALELCARTAEALDYAHNQQVVHRDIKPANLLYNRKDDSLKISDFGVARMTDNNRTKTGIVLGTPMYMSPEQLTAEPVTGLSDLFSLGVTLYELLVGEVPFTATNIAMLMSKITSEEQAPVSNRRPGIPPNVDALLSKALAKRPENRFVNGGEMAAALRNSARYAST